MPHERRDNDPIIQRLDDIKEQMTQNNKDFKEWTIRHQDIDHMAVNTTLKEHGKTIGFLNVLGMILGFLGLSGIGIWIKSLVNGK